MKLQFYRAEVVVGKFIDMTGWVMAEHGVPESRLTVIGFDHKEIKDGRTRIFWECVCTCGKHIVVKLGYE